MKKILIVLFLLLFTLYSQTDITFSIESKYGDGTSILNQGSTIEPYNYFENLLDVNISFTSGVSLWGQLEYSDDPVFGKPMNALNKFYFEYIQQNALVRIGDIYTIYGRGLSLNTIMDQNIDYDNSLRGIEFDYSINDQSRIFAMLGKTRFDFRTNPAMRIPDRWIDTKAYSLGYEIDLEKYGILQTFILNQNSRLDESMLSMYYEERNDTRIGRDFANRVIYEDYRTDTLNSKIYNINWTGSFDLFDIYFEYENNHYSKILGDEVPGSKFYGSFFTQLGLLGITYEIKDYNTPYFIQSLNNSPTVFREGTSILSSRYNHSMNFGDERGHQLEFQMPIGKAFNWMMNIAQSNRHVGPYKLYSHNFILDPDSVDVNELILDINSISSYIWSEQIESERNYNHPGFFDLFSMNFSNDDLAYLPFRQIYTEISGYAINNKLYFQIGLDWLDEVTKYHDTESYIYKIEETEKQTLETFLDSISSYWISNQISVFEEGMVSLENDYNYFLLICAYDINCADNLFQTTYFTSTTYQDSISLLMNIINSSSDSLELQWTQSINTIVNPENIQKFEYEKHNVITLPMRFSWNIGDGSSFSSYWEHQWRNYESNHDEVINMDNTLSSLTQKETYYNQYLTIAFNSSKNWTLTWFYDGETHTKKIGQTIYSDKYQEWTGIDLTMDISSSSAISVFYGSQKGGRICANGICADQPGFQDGFKITYRSFF